MGAVEGARIRSSETFRWGAAFFLALAAPNPVSSAEYTLDQVLRNARWYWISKTDSPAIAARLNYDLAKTANLPRLGTSYSLSKNFLAPNSPADKVGAISLSQSVLDVSNWESVRARKADLVSGACDAEASLLEISRQVVGDFYGALANLDEEKIQRQRQARMERLIEFLRETTSLRFSAKSDLLSAQSQNSGVAGQLLQIAVEKENSLSRIRSQLGIPPEDPLTISDRFLEGSGPDLADWAQWGEYLPEAVSLKAKMTAAGYDLASARWEAAPTVELRGTYLRPYGEASGADSLTGAIAVTLPLFDQGARYARAANARRYRFLYEGQYLAKRTAYSNQIRALISARDRTTEALAQARIQHDLAERAFRGMWELLSIGKRDYIAIRAAEEDLISAQRQHVALQRSLDQTNGYLQLFFESVQRARNPSASKDQCAPAALE